MEGKYEVVCGTALDTQGLLNIYIGFSEDLFIFLSYTSFWLRLQEEEKIFGTQSTVFCAKPRLI